MKLENSSLFEDFHYFVMKYAFLNYWIILRKATCGATFVSSQVAENYLNICITICLHQWNSLLQWHSQHLYVYSPQVSLKNIEPFLYHHQQWKDIYVQRKNKTWNTFFCIEKHGPQHEPLAVWYDYCIETVSYSNLWHFTLNKIA